MDVVELTEQNGIAVLLLNRPEARNALNADLTAALRLAVQVVAAGDTARALVLAGAGPTFCAGGDLRHIREATTRGEYDSLGSVLDDLQATVRLLRTLPMPVVAAVEGAAAGAGLALAMAADLRVLGRSTVFVPAFLAAGASPDGGASYFLARMLGGPQTMSALLRNHRFSAAELGEAGIADRIVDEGCALAEACALAAEVAGAPPRALVAARSLVDLAPTQRLAEHLDAEAATMRSIWACGEFAEGATAFLERRPARFDRHSLVAPEECRT